MAGADNYQCGAWPAGRQKSRPVIFGHRLQLCFAAAQTLLAIRLFVHMI